MGLLTPLALLALGAVAVPIWIHLSQRDRKEEIEFPSLMFLERIPYKAVRKQAIRNWPLFLLRLGVLILLVAAFARPFFGSGSPGVLGSGGPVDRVVLLDRSRSMSVGERWETTTRLAREALRSVPAGSRTSLVLFDSRVTVPAPLSTDPTAALTVLDTLSPSDGGTRFAPALQATASILDDPDRAREVVLITDLQASGWPDGARSTLPSEITLALQTPEDPGVVPLNPHLAGLRVTTRQSGDTTLVRVSALLTGLPGEGVPDIPVMLRLGDAEVSRTAVALDGRATIPVTLEGPLSASGTEADRRQVPGSLVMDAPGPKWDDTLRFVAEPAANVPVLIVDDSQNRRGSLFLARALAVGADPGFPTEMVTPSGLTPAALETASALILNDVPAPGGRARDAIDAFLAGGGGVLVVLGPDATGDWPSSLLPGSLAGPTDLGDSQGVTLSALALDHPILEPFREAGAGEFSRARFFRSRPMEIEDTTAVSVAAFTSGASALVEIPHPQGRVVLWSSTLDDFWTDLPRQAVFLPFVHQVIQYLADYQPPTPAFEVGTPLAPLLAEGRPGSERPAGSNSDGPVVTGPGGGSLSDMDRAGLYVVEMEGSRSLFAANLDPTESDLTPLDPDAFVREVSGPGDGSSPRFVDEGLSEEDRESRQAIWRTLLILMLVLLIVETALANRPRGRVRLT